MDPYEESDETQPVVEDWMPTDPYVGMSDATLITGALVAAGDHHDDEALTTTITGLAGRMGYLRDLLGLAHDQLHGLADYADEMESLLQRALAMLTTDATGPSGASAEWIEDVLDLIGEDDAVEPASEQKEASGRAVGLRSVTR